MPKYGYLVLEGPHDVEFAYGLLRPFGLERVRFIADLDPFWNDLVPKGFPVDGDLQKRVPVPLFLKSASHSVALHSARSDTRLVKTIDENISLIGKENFTSIGLVFDSDTDQQPTERYAPIKSAMDQMGFVLPENLGEINAGPPRIGAFILPDNRRQGTLEDLLLEAAQEVYPKLLASAKVHVENASRDDTLKNDDLKELRKPAGKNKAIVASISNILKPGKAVQVSLQDNRWIRDDGLNVANVKAVQSFLSSLLELP